MKDKFLGIFLGFLGYTIFVFLDSIIKKYLVQDYPVLEINFYRGKTKEIIIKNRTYVSNQNYYNEHKY